MEFDVCGRSLGQISLCGAVRHAVLGSTSKGGLRFRQQNIKANESE